MKMYYFYDSPFDKSFRSMIFTQLHFDEERLDNQDSLNVRENLILSRIIIKENVLGQSKLL